MITINVNDSKKTLSKETTVIQLMKELKIQSNGIAVAINNNIIKKSDWKNHTLSGEDTVLIIKSTQGG